MTLPHWRPSVWGRVWLRVLELVFPRSFRDRFGKDYEEFLTRQRTERRYVGFLGSVRFWRDVTLDAVRGGLSLRVRPARSTAVRQRRVALGVWLDGLGQDIGYGVRTLIRAPTYAVVSIVTLGLGIGTNSAMFTVVNGVLLQPLSYPDAHQLVMVFHATPADDRSSMSYLDFRDYAAANDVFATLGGWTEAGGTLTGGGEPEEVSGVRVTADVLPLLAVQPALGRFIAPGEDVPGGPRAILLSHRLWVTRYGRDSTVIGSIATLDGRAHEIIGVMPADFAFPNALADFWTPMRQDELLRDVGIANPDRDLSFMIGIGRLRPGSTLERATEELSALALQVRDRENPDRALIGMNIVPLRTWLVGSSRDTLFTLMGAVGFVLVIACVNVANLTVTRTAGRGRELALRTALGARRMRIVRQIVTEGLLLAAVGGAFGILLATGLTEWLVRGQEVTLPRHTEVSVDARAVLFTAGLAIASGLCFGMLAAVSMVRGELAQPLRDAGVRGGVSVSARRLHHVLVVSQVGLALTLLVGAGLLGDSFRRLSDVEPGFPVDDLVLVELGVSDDRYDSDERIGLFYESVVRRVGALPGVEAVSTTYSPAFAENDFRQTIVLEGEPEDDRSTKWVGTVIVGEDYFKTSGVPIVAGRGFEHTDVAGTPRVAVVSRAMAERHWPDRDPVGKRFRVDGGVSGSIASLEDRFFTRDWITVVGVAGDVRRGGLADAPGPEYYQPHSQMRWLGMSILIRTSVDPQAVIPAIPQAVWDVDPNVPIAEVQTMGEALSGQVAAPRWRTMLLATFAILAMGLAAVGIYGVTSYGVTQRVKEIGIRMALGAPQARVRREILMVGVRVASVGVALGVAGALFLARLLESLLFEVTVSQPAVYLAAAGVMVAVTVVACYVPARRASSVDLLTALRDS